MVRLTSFSCVSCGHRTSPPAELADELVQFIEARIPQLAIALEPVVQFPERFRPQLVEALLGDRLHVDQPGLQRAQMLRACGWVSQSLTDVVDRRGPERSSSTIRSRVGSPRAANVSTMRLICPVGNIPVKAFRRRPPSRGILLGRDSGSQVQPSRALVLTPVHGLGGRQPRHRHGRHNRGARAAERLADSPVPAGHRSASSRSRITVSRNCGRPDCWSRMSRRPTSPR